MLSCMGFPANVSHNLPVWDGVVAVFNSGTGAMVAIIEDHGLLTDWRTAAAGPIATQACGEETDKKPNIFAIG